MLNFRSPPALTARIDAWIGAQPDPKPSRSEAIRRLVEKALFYAAFPDPPLARLREFEQKRQRCGFESMI
jgi:DNA-binding transcriptional LysR family regulator